MKYTELTEDDFTLVTSNGKMVITGLELEKKQIKEAAIYREDDNSYCCLLPAGDRQIQLPQINGLNINYQEFRKVGSSSLGKYILISCNHKAYIPNFIQILKEILSQFDNSNLDLCDCLVMVISKWRHFLSAPQQNILDEENIIGLLGELLFLELIIREVNYSFIQYWTADRGEEDFICGNTIIEIKTSPKEKHAHYINGIDQLLVDPSNKKYILSILLTESGFSEELTLPILIDKIASILSYYPNLLDLFYNKLKARNYDIRDSVHYEPYRYFVYRAGLFNVDDNFPKLTNKELSQPLNPRISKVRYLLDMEGLSNIEMFSVDYKKILNNGQ